MRWFNWFQHRVAMWIYVKVSPETFLDVSTHSIRSDQRLLMTTHEGLFEDSLDRWSVLLSNKPLFNTHFNCSMQVSKTRQKNIRFPISLVYRVLNHLNMAFGSYKDSAFLHKQKTVLSCWDGKDEQVQQLLFLDRLFHVQICLMNGGWAWMSPYFYEGLNRTMQLSLHAPMHVPVWRRFALDQHRREVRHIFIKPSTALLEGRYAST